MADEGTIQSRAAAAVPPVISAVAASLDYISTPSAMLPRSPVPGRHLPMDIYLPIAEMSVNLFLLLGFGGVVGFLSGRVRGRRRLPDDAAADLHRHPAGGRGRHPGEPDPGSSFSGVIAHWRRGNVDVRMGMVLVAGGLVGSALGVWLFASCAGSARSTS